MTIRRKQPVDILGHDFVAWVRHGCSPWQPIGQFSSLASAWSAIGGMSGAKRVLQNGDDPNVAETGSECAGQTL